MGMNRAAIFFCASPEPEPACQNDDLDGWARSGLRFIFIFFLVVHLLRRIWFETVVLDYLRTILHPKFGL